MRGDWQGNLALSVAAVVAVVAAVVVVVVALVVKVASTFVERRSEEWESCGS